MRGPYLYLLVLLSCFSSVCLCVSIADFGAVAGDTSDAAARKNVHALSDAFRKANSSTADRTVVLPDGVFTIFNVSIANMNQMTFRIDGTLSLSKSIKAWNIPPNDGGMFGALQFTQCNSLTISGGSSQVAVDGQGYDWWWHVILQETDHRPHMFVVDESSDLLIENLAVINSPQFHFKLHDVADVLVRNVSIRVDAIQHSLPVFPLNTDGIDPSGKNITIEDCYIENYDDAVAVKPSHGGYKLSSCSEDILIRNVRVKFGVGLTIGSVPPNLQHNCVRNVVFEDCSAEDPIKGIYVKSNPGDKGTGLIENIVYRNYTAVRPLWEPIWIGPQQQKQPGTKGTGCSFFYPLVDKCPTNPRVTIRNITLESVHMHGALLNPGVILCNASNPCADFHWRDVSVSGVDIVSKQWLCKELVSSSMVDVSPAMKCANQLAGDKEQKSMAE